MPCAALILKIALRLFYQWVGKISKLPDQILHPPMAIGFTGGGLAGSICSLQRIQRRISNLRIYSVRFLSQSGDFV